ncbi:MAG: protein yraN [Firmicutes bacterium]|nr:protein yraN [Bacillota bacterium]
MGGRVSGLAGEKLAQEHLIQKGYKILEANYRTATGEIDIIAKTGRTLVFIEVKTRASNRYGNPAEAVTWYKQKKIIKTALWYLKQTAQVDAQVRFDVIEVWLSSAGVQTKLNHIINAFDGY